ncbi:DUF1800 domain-containing protein [Flavobacteriaceae bacterium]|nr:DUF1800 domain-containing protein [Flavobacteriaceae bacterium]
MQKGKPNQEPPIDLVEQFYKENVDLKAILNARKVKKEVTSGLEPYTGEFGPVQKKHLLNRTMVGMAKRHMDDIEGLTLDEAIDLIFTPEELGEPINNYFYEITNEEWNEKYGRDDVGPGEPFVYNDCVRIQELGNDESNDNYRGNSVNSFFVERIYNQNTSIHWKLFLFFHNLIPSKDGPGGYKGFFGYFKLIFDSCYRDYRKTIYDITVNSSMLTYLNLGLSRKETPDENYAREVQELFTVGKRPFSKYTEEDVREVARALVGWHIDWDSWMEEGLVTSSFDKWNHDTGDKYFSEFYENKIIRGREGEDGAKELDDVIEMIFNTEQSAIYLSSRLYQFFVYHDISNAIEENIIKPMAKVMRENNFSLIEPLKLLLSSEHFFDTSFYNSMIKSPQDFVYGLVKEIDLFSGTIENYQQQQNGNENYIPPEKLTNPITRGYYFSDHIRWRTWGLGQSIGNPPSVSGWPAFYQAPVYDLFWINSMTLQFRVNTSETITRWGVWLEDGNHLTFDKVEYILTYPNVDNLDALIQELSDRFLGSNIPTETKQRIKQSVLNGVNESYWTEAISDYKNNPTPNKKRELNNRVQELLSKLFQVGEINLF